MNKAYDQPFDEPTKFTAYFLVEISNGDFLQLIFIDELNATYVRTLSTELDMSHNIVTRMTKYLHDTGFELTKFREIARETSVAYSLIDEVPGSTQTHICFHVNVDRIERRVHLGDYDKYKPIYVSLETMLDNLHDSISFEGVVELGIAQLINERQILE